MSDIRKQSIECPVRHGQPVGRQNVQELLGRELPENVDDFDCFDSCLQFKSLWESSPR